VTGLFFGQPSKIRAQIFKGVDIVSDPDLERGIHAQISRLARSLHGYQVHGDALLLEVTETAVRLLPGVDHAGITLAGGRRGPLRSTAATGPVPRKVDELQEKFQEGPCLESIWDHHTVRVDDYQSEPRWPNFVGALNADSPVRSSLSIQLFTDQSELGALNLYSEQPDAFTEQVEDLAVALAAHAAVGLSGSRRGEQFRSALASRDIIGQAKGVVMERYNINAVTAFKLLVRLSQESNVPVHDIAQMLVDASHPADR
jgi:GAF domain-containing protein